MDKKTISKPVEKSAGPSNSEILKLLKQNIELTQESIKLSKKVRRYQIISSLWGWLKLAILIGIIIFGLVFVPRFVRTQFETISTSFKEDGVGAIFSGFGFSGENFSPEEILKQYQQR